ncbi:4806_t:CDS:1, partial [Funneliformis geosporum]
SGDRLVRELEMQYVLSWPAHLIAKSASLIIAYSLLAYWWDVMSTSEIYSGSRQ